MHKQKFPILLKLMAGITAIVATAVIGAVAFMSFTPVQAATGINEQINYQGRLLTGTGAVVPDGSYNMEFKIVQDGDGCNPTSGTFPCSGSVEWTETRESGNKVLVKNGYFSVYLGSITAFGSSVDWNQDTLWLGISIGGTGSPSYDGVMEPLTRLSSTPYALNSKQLGGLTASQFVQLSPAGQQTGNINVSGTLTSGQINGQTISSAAIFGGTVAIQGANALTLGVTGTSSGALLFKGATGASGTITLQGPSNPGTYSLTLPSALGSSGDCLKDTNGAGILGFSACGGITLAITLQGAYDATNGNTIVGTTGRNISITLADLVTDQTFEITQVGTANAFRVNDDGTFTDTTPFVIDASGNVGIGTAGATARLDVAVAIGDNVQGLLVTQNDTTNNPRAVSILNAGTAASLYIQPTGNTSASISTGGAILLNNTSNTGAGLVVYSNQGAAAGHLVSVRSDNALFDQSGLYVSYNGTANGGNFINTSTSSTSGALNVGSTNPNESTLKVSGEETGKGTIKISHTGTGTDANASALSINLAGAGTAAQGIFLDSTSGTTGKLLNVRNASVDVMTLDSASLMKISKSVVGVQNFINMQGTGAFSGSEPALVFSNSAGAVETARISSKPGAGYINSLFTIATADSSKVLQPRLSIDVSGNVGIGDTTPTYALTVGNGDLFGVQSTGDLIWEGSVADAFELTVTVANPTADRTYTIPDSTGNATDNFCLLTLANCSGSASTLQASYGADVDGSDTLVTLTTVDDSLIIRNPSSAGTDSGYVLSVDQLNTGNVDGVRINNAGTGDLLELSDDGAVVGRFADGGHLLGNNTATGTTGTTEATARTNVTTVTLTAAGSFANNDIIFINNAGQDYYTRIVSGGGTTTLTVSPAVSYDVSTTVTKYTAQNLGATATDYTTQSNRYFQGYFLGGVVVGAGSTTLSDGNLKSTGSLVLQGDGGNVGIGTTTPGQQLHTSASVNGATGIRIQNTNSSSGAVAQLELLGDARQFNVGVGSSTNTLYADKFIVYDQTATAARLVIDTNGNLGVGTNSPQATFSGRVLHIYNNAGIAEMRVEAASGSTAVYSLQVEGATADWHFENSGGQYRIVETGAAERLVISTGGNVGIGDVSPAYLFTVGNGDVFGIDSSGNLIFEGATADAFEFTIGVADPTADRTLTIPNSTVATDTFCLVTLANCGSSADTLDTVYTADSDKTLSINSTTGMTFDMTTTGSIIFEDNNSVFLTINDTGSYTFIMDSTDNPAYTITNNGSSNVITNLAGTGDFVIQDGGVQAFFVSDTGAIFLGKADAGVNVTIGDGSASTTPDLFVLDQKTATGDPTGTNGAMYYNNGDNKFRCYEAGAWKNCDTTGGGGGATYVVTTANVASTASTAYQNITGLSWTLAAGTRYEIECQLRYDTSAATIGIGVGWTGPASPVFSHGQMVAGLSGGATFGGTTSVGNDTGGVTASSVGATNDNIARFDGFWSTNGGGGTLQMRFKPETAIASGVTILTGSWCKYETY